MKTFKKVQVEQQQLSLLTCNKCGIVKEITDEPLGFVAEHQFQQFTFNFGYGSRFDDETWSFDLCEDCLDEFTKTFLIPKEASRHY